MYTSINIGESKVSDSEIEHITKANPGLKMLVVE